MSNNKDIFDRIEKRIDSMSVDELKSLIEKYSKYRTIDAPFICDNCDYNATPEETIEKNGDCPRCKTGILHSFTIDSAESMMYLKSIIKLQEIEIQKFKSKNEEIDSKIADLERKTRPKGTLITP